MAISELVLDSPSTGTGRRRKCPRYTLRSLAYVKLNESNGGIVRDLGESGIAVQAVAPLRLDEILNLQFDLLSPRIRVEGQGRVCWADSNGQGGIQFCDLSSKTRRALRDWMFIQMLSTAAVAGRDSIFSFPSSLILSSGARAPIIVDRPAEPPTVPFLTWGRWRLSVKNFSLLIDFVIILCAVLLFSTAALITMGGIPAWPLTAGLLIVCCLIFVLAYQVIFSELFCGSTVGRRLALLAQRQDAEEPVPRFR
ncbi:MAG: PilZ domain-containing protein [Acidobacteria bacterium]|nr:PilZ domain-containing protein [Acidobacteriota bacterium]